MTRIFETPRYAKQTLNKMNTLIGFSLHVENMKIIQKRTGSIQKDLLQYPALLDELNPDASTHYSRYIHDNWESIEESVEGYLDSKCNIDLYDLKMAKSASEQKLATDEYAFSYLENINKNMDSDKMKYFGTNLASILQGVKDVYTDDRAMYEFMLDLLTGKVSFGKVQMNERAARLSALIIRDSLVANLSDCRVGGPGISNVVNDYVPSYMRRGRFQIFKNAKSVLERFVIGRLSKNIELAHKKTWDEDYEVAIEDFKDVRDGLITALGDIEVYRVLGFTMFKLYDKCYVFDYSSLTQVYQCASWWANAGAYVYNYRLSGDKEREVDGYVKSFDIIFKWLGKVNRDDYFKITRAMKMAYNIMMNNFHSKGENKDLGGKERGDALLKDLAELGLRAPDVYNMLTTLPVSDRAKMDIAYCFHGLPAPDCDVELLFRSFTTKMKNSNDVNETEWRKFMAYSKTFDLEALVRKYKYDILPYVVQDEGYNLEDQDWFKDAVQGKHVYIPDSHLGKAYVKGFYKLELRMDQWAFDAGDVTRVIADKLENTYVDLINDKRNHDHNELLYAFKYAPYLNYVYTPKEVRKAFIKQEYIGDQIVVAAAKSENTKFGAKVRETFSGDDILREITSEVDSLARKPIMLGTASSLRSDPVSLNKKMTNIAELTRKTQGKKVVIMSLDVSGWSPNANRKYFMEIIRYHSQLTDIPSGYDLEPLWENIMGVIRKRGIFMKEELKTGMFQGFTGTMDTAFHQKVLFYAIRVCKREGVLRLNESAFGLCLIDDGVIALELDDKRDDDDVKETCTRFCDSIISTYRKIGLVIDSVKTINSDTKYVYLNRFFSSGNEILTPMKTVCKIDRELNRKFSTIRDQIASIMGSGSNALNKGSDPVSTWIICVERVTEIALLCNDKIYSLSSLKILMLFHTPATMGGLGIPTMAEWLCSEFTDKELRYASWVAALSNSFRDKSSVAVLLTMFDNIMNQELDANICITDMKNVRSIRYKLKYCAERMSRSHITDAVIKFTESKMFKEAFELLENRNYKMSVHNAITKLTVDASVIEELINNGPIAAMAPLIDKAMKNEIINVMMSYKTKRYITAGIRMADTRSINEFITILNKPVNQKNILLFKVESAQEYISNIREKFYTLNNLTITNHTMTDPLHVLARTGDYDKCSVSVSFEHLKAAASDSKNSEWTFAEKSYNNMYDSSTPDGRYVGYRTKGIIDKSSMNYRSMSKISRCVTSGISLCAYLSGTENSGEAAYNLFTSMWGYKESNLIPRVNRKIMEGVSTKRMGSSFTTKNNTCSIFPNCSNVVKVDGSNLGRYMDSNRINLNLMSVINVSRVCGLMEFATTRSRPQTFNYNIRPMTISKYEEALFEVLEGKENEFLEALTDIHKNNLKNTRDWYTTCMTNVLTDATNDTCIVVEDINADEGDANPGGLDGLFNHDSMFISSQYIPIINFKRKPETLTDYAILKPAFSVQSMFRKLRNRYGDANAYIATLMLSIYKESNYQLTDDLYKSNRSEYPALYNQVFGDKDPELLLSSCSSIAKNLKVSDLSLMFKYVNGEMRKAMLGKKLVDKTHTGQDRSFNYKSAVMILYMMYQGRLVNSNMYAVMCADNPKLKKKTIQFAIRRNLLIRASAVDSIKKLYHDIAVDVYYVAGTLDPSNFSLREAASAFMDCLKNYIRTKMRSINDSLDTLEYDIHVPVPEYEPEDEDKYITMFYNLIQLLNNKVIAKNESPIPNDISKVIGSSLFDFSFMLLAHNNRKEYDRLKLFSNSSKVDVDLGSSKQSSIALEEVRTNFAPSLASLITSIEIAPALEFPTMEVDISAVDNFAKRCTALSHLGMVSEAIACYRSGRIPEELDDMVDISDVEDGDVDDFISLFENQSKPDDG